MTTSLQRQLTSLAAPSSSLLIPERRRSSIIFSPQDAAKYDRETFYQIGLDGLNELISINPSIFIPFRESMIFAESSKKLERAVEDSDVNQTLDVVIEEFLMAICPYLMLKATLKCMEWLVHRFHIERFNVDAVLRCILPYYDTKNFVMIIQVLAIEKFQGNYQWEWLIPCIQSGAPLRKATLFDISNPKFILWIFESFGKLLKVHKDHPENLRVYLGFMASTFVGILNKLKGYLHSQPLRVEKKKMVPMNILTKIHELLAGIRSNEEYEELNNNDEIYSMCYVVMAMLAVCGREIPEMTQFIGAGLKQIFKIIIVNRASSQLTETFLLMNLMIDYLRRDWIFNPGATFNNTLLDLAQVSQNWNISTLASKLILENVNPKNGKNALTPSEVFHWVEIIQLNSEVRSEILRNVYLRYRTGGNKKVTKSFLTMFERQYPIEFEMASKKDGRFASDLAKIKTGKDFIVLSQHSDSQIRTESVTKLLNRAVVKRVMTDEPTSDAKDKKSKYRAKATTAKSIIPDQNSTAVALLPRFLDDSSDVLIAFLKPKVKILQKIFTNETLTKGLISLVKRNVAIKPTKMALQKLCAVAKSLDDSELELKQQIMNVIIPFLFPRKPLQLRIAKTILSTKFAANEKFLQQYLTAEQFVTANEMSKHSYSLITKIDEQYKYTLVSELESAVQAVFACLLLKPENIINTILKFAEENECTSCSGVSYPVDEDSFARCLKVAEKKERLSLELVLTALCRSPNKDFNSILKILKFVWKSAEILENRDACMKFLSQYLKSCFSNAEKEYHFWQEAIRRAYKERRQSVVIDDVEELEFFLIRTIQFTTAFIQRNMGIFDLEKGESSSQISENDNLEPHKPLTRSQRKGLAPNAPPSPSTPRKGARKNAGQKEDNASKLSSWNLVQILISQGLADKCAGIRTWSLKCLKTLTVLIPADQNINDFINYVLKFRKEILTDHEQITTVISRALDNKDFIQIRKRCLESLMREDVDEFERIALLTLCRHANSQLFQELRPKIKNLLRSDPNSNFMLELLSLYDSSTLDEELLEQSLQHKEVAKIVLKKIDREAFESYDSASKKKLFALFTSKSLTCESPEIKVAIQRCVRKWTLDAGVVAHELMKCIGMEKRWRSNAGNASISKSSKETVQHSDGDWSARAEIVLEFVQGKKRLISKTTLIQSLFRLLKICIAMEEQTPVEYLKQLVLTALTICCQEDEDSDEAEPKDLVFHVESVIDCLRCSRNPQTHHHALILLNYAAKRFPEQVLHGVMSLFTFMGNSILRQDDTYSTQLIQQTVVTIIPTLATAGKGGSERSVVSASIYRVFTSAVQDIPVHRRLPVFSSLVETLNPESTMWQLCIIVVDNALQRDRKRSNLNADLELAVDLVWSFKPSDVVHTVEMIYSFICSLPVLQKDITEERFNAMKARQDPMEKSVLDYGRKETARDVHIVLHYVLELVSQICSRFGDLEKEKLDYDGILERCMVFSRLLSHLSEEKIFRLIAHRNLEVIDKVNLALEPADFVQIMILILHRDDITVKRKMMEMLNQRILQKVEWFGDLKLLLTLLPVLVEIAGNEPETDEMTTLVQTSFFSLKLIAKHLALLYPDDFVPVFELTIEQTRHKNKLLGASALLCMGELFCLKSLILPNLNRVTSAILKAFKSSAKMQLILNETIKDDEQEKTAVVTNDGNDPSTMAAHLLCISTITCLNKMIEHLGSFVGAKFLKKSLVALLSINSQFGHGEKADHRRKVFEQKLKILLKSIASKIPLRNSLMSIRGAFTKVHDDSKGVCTLVRLLRDTLTSTTKPDFTLIVHTLTDTFLEDLLLYREKQSAVLIVEQDYLDVADETNKVEDAILDCLITGIVLKMSESHFRPFYHKIFDWAGDNIDRLITFYRLSAAAAERLKSLFVTFAGYVINQAVMVLNKDIRLTKAIIKFFFHIFSNDREGFVTTDRFNSLVKPLVDMIESDYVLDGGIDIKDVNDTLIQLAVATNDLNRWQYLIELISFKSSHSNKTVRLHVLSTLEAAANELSKDFLPLLPPAVPFLAELMNDDDPEVEAETQKLLLKLEDIVGEPLQPYFTT